MLYTSNAEWPEEVKLGCIPNVSTDTHDSREFAYAICRRLNEEGFGGDGEIFPIRTWVEEVPSEEDEFRPSKAMTNLALIGASAGVNMGALLSRALGKAKTKKNMGPGAGTSRMKRNQRGKGW